jgi:hypothetical protein
MGAAAVAYGEHLVAAPGPADEREAAYRASVDELTTAWKDENPEFGNALSMAFVLERTSTASDPSQKDYLDRTSTEPDPTGPLKDYLASDKPMSLGNRLGLVTLIERLDQRIASLEERIASMQKRGRPRRKPIPGTQPTPNAMRPCLWRAGRRNGARNVVASACRQPRPRT